MSECLGSLPKHAPAPTFSGVTTLGHLSHQEDREAGQPDGLSQADLQCPICVEPLQDAFVTPCGHTFCYQCITTHLRHKRNCPSCASYLTTEHIYPNFLLNKIIHHAAVTPGFGQKESLATVVQQVLQGSKQAVQPRELEATIQLLQSHRDHLVEQEETSGLHLLLLLLQDARRRKQAAMTELQAQLGLLEKDMRAVSKQAVPRAMSVAAAERYQQPPEVHVHHMPGEVPVSGNGIPGLPGSGRSFVVVGQASSQIEVLQQQLYAAAKAAMQQGGSLHVHTLNEQQVSSISIQADHLQGMDPALLAAAVQAGGAQAKHNGPAAGTQAGALPGASSQGQLGQVGGALQVAGRPSSSKPLALPGQAPQGQMSASEHQAVQGQEGGSLVQHGAHSRGRASPESLEGGGAEGTWAHAAHGAQPSSEAGEHSDDGQQTPTSTAHMQGTAGAMDVEADKMVPQAKGTALQPAQTVGPPLGAANATASAQQVATGGAAQQGVQHKPRGLQGASQQQQQQQRKGASAAQSVLGARPASVASPDNQQSFTELRAAKRRLIMSQFDDLERCYFRLHHSDSGIKLPAAPAAGGVGSEGASRAAAGAQPLGQDRASSQPAAAPGADGQHGSVTMLRQFSEVLNGMTTYSRMAVQAEIPQAACGGPAYPAARTSRTSSNGGAAPRSAGSSLVSCIDFDCAGRLFATCSAQRLFLWDYAAVLPRAPEQQAAAAQLHSRTKLTGVAFSRLQQQLLAACDSEGLVCLYDASTLQLVLDIEAHDSRIWALDFAPQGNGGGGAATQAHCFASGSDDYTVRVWDCRDGRACSTIDTRANVCSVRYNPWDPHYLAVGSAGHAVFIYDLRKAGGTAAPLCTLTGHNKAVSYVRWTTQQELVSASTDSSLRLWDLTQAVAGDSQAGSSGSGGAPQCVRTYKGHVNERNFVGLAVEGDLIAAGSETNEVVVYYKPVPSPCLRLALSSGQPASAAGGAGGRRGGANGGGGRGEGPTGGRSSQSGMLFISSVTWHGRDNVLLAASSSGSVSVLALQQ